MKNLRIVVGFLLIISAVGMFFVPRPWKPETAAKTLFKIRLDGPDAGSGWEVYEMIILGEGETGKDHWGWGAGTAVYDSSGRVALSRQNPNTWLAIDAGGNVSIQLPNSGSKQISGVARIIKRANPGSAKGTHGVAGFGGVAWHNTN